MTSEGEVVPENRGEPSPIHHKKHLRRVLVFEISYGVSLMRINCYFSREYTHWIATLPSTLPMAKPLLLLELKQVITRVCHFRGDCMVCGRLARSEKKAVSIRWRETDFECSIGIVQIIYLDVTLSRPDNQKRVLHIEGITSLGNGYGSDRRRRPKIPVLPMMNVFQ